MRAFALIVAFLLSQVSYAGCWKFVEYKSGDFFLEIGDGGCSYPEDMISYWKGNEPMQQVPFSEECVLHEYDNLLDGYSGFSCKETGRSPLAGATYKLIKRGKPYCDPGSPAGGGAGYQYKCIAGCKKSVPKYLTKAEDCC